jgi:hypothetical protein
MHMDITMRVLAGIFVFLSLCAPAVADLTFAEWAKGPPDKRAIYTAGVVETIGTYAEALGFVDKWKQCLARLNLSYGAVGDGAISFAKNNGGMDNQPAPGVIVVYMNTMCGFTNNFKR